MRSHHHLLIFLTLLLPLSGIAQDPIQVTLHPQTVHSVGEITHFEREKFITLHSSPAEADWDDQAEKLEYLARELDVYFGRETGAITYELSRAKEDPDSPGRVDFASLEARAKQVRETYAMDHTARAFETHKDLVICGQVEPFWPGSGPIRPEDGSEAWTLRDADATGQYMGYWLNRFTGGNGQLRPKYLEIINEPLYELGISHPEVTPQQVFDYHRKVARRIRSLNQDVLLGGYTAAFPDFEIDDFGRWERRWKTFIDTAGDEMDFYSFHLYDFPGIHQGKEQYRKGANLEATLDLLEHYSVLTSGEVKPFLISEYGSQLHDWYHQPWSPYRDWLCLKAINSMLMQFAERPDRILKAIPFITAKAEWGHDYGGSGQPYYWRLLRRADEPEANTGDWVFTDQIKLYQLWADVRGERRLIRSDDPDLLVNSYLDGDVLTVIFNNLAKAPKEIALGGAFEATSLQIRHLYPYEKGPRLDALDAPATKRDFTLGSESTMVLRFTVAGGAEAVDLATERKTYADRYLVPIEEDQPLEFRIDAQPAAAGEAVLRVGIGRDHGLTTFPTITWNGQPLPVPQQYAGPPQLERERFFGVLEIPVPVATLQAENHAVLRFPDAGGHLSSLALEVTRVDPR